MPDAPQHGPTPPAPGQLTVGLALAGVRPRQMRDDEWAAMHEASTAGLPTADGLGAFPYASGETFDLLRIHARARATDDAPLAGAVSFRFRGIPVRLDASVPPGEVHVRDSRGTVVERCTVRELP